MNGRAGFVSSQVVWLASLPVTVTGPVWSSAVVHLPYYVPFLVPIPGQGMKDALAGFILAGLASFLPDLDHKTATVGRYIPGWVRKAFGGHRMGSHSAISVAVSWFLTGYLLGNPTLASAVALGWSTHILLDMLTVDGVGLFYPLVSRKIRIGWMVTGSRTEDRFVTGVKVLGWMVAVSYGAMIIFSAGGT